MIKTKKRGNLIIISGFSGAGKGTVVKELLNNDSNRVLSVSYTSRNMRDGETNGKEYHFITEDEFETKIENNEIFEHNFYDNNYYGTPKDITEDLLSQGKDVILEIEVNGAKIVKEQLPETILVFILPPSMNELKQRLKKRGNNTNEQLVRRFETAYREINEINKYNYVVVNDILEEAVNKVEAILISEKCRVDRIEEMAIENKEEIIHEFLMDKEFDNSIKKITDI